MEDILTIQHLHIFKPFPGGESYADMAARYRSFLQEAELRYDAKQTAVMIGHYGTRALLKHLCLQVPLEDAFNSPVRQRAMSRKWIMEEHFKEGDYPSFVYSTTGVGIDGR